MDTKKKSRKLGDLKLHTTFGLHFGDKFYPSFDKNSFQRTSLEQYSYRVSNMPFHSNGHTGIFLSKKSIKAGTSLTEQEAEKETKLVNVNYMYIHSLQKLPFSCFIIISSFKSYNSDLKTELLNLQHICVTFQVCHPLFKAKLSISF